MKRLVSVIIVIILLPFAAAAAESTKKMDAFAFFGLYVKRMMEYQSIYGVDVSLRVEGLNFPYASKGEVIVTTTAGDLTFDEKDFLLKEVMMTAYNSGQDSTKNNLYLVNAIAAMSALEYNELSEKLMKSTYELGIEGGAPSAVQMMTSIFNTELLAKLSAAASLKSDKELLVYSGNYDYYIAYFKPSSEETDLVFLIARAR